MRIINHDLNQNVMIVAEIGNNHEGNFSLAEEMIYLAKDAGVDAVKFQTFRTEHYVSKTNQQRFQMLKKFELTFDEFFKLSELSKNIGLTFLSTPFDIESAKFLNEIVPAFKIASGDNTFYLLIKEIASFTKPIILSTGLADIQTIETAKEVIESEWNAKGYKGDLALLHCVSEYPVKPEDVNLLGIKKLKDHFGCTVGFSDHTIGITASNLAVALGARIIEKHFTIDNNYSDFRDHKMSSNPKEMKELVYSIREAETYLGKYDKIPSLNEKNNEVLFRRGIISVRDINVGEILTLADITWVRPKGELCAGDEEKIIGKKVIKVIKEGDSISLSCFE